MGGVVDVFKGITGLGTTKAEKQVKAAQAQQASLLAAQSADAQAQLEERKKRMQSKQAGRASLLSGTEMGIQQPLKSTLG